MNQISSEFANLLVDCSLKSVAIALLIAALMLAFRITGRNQHSPKTQFRVWMFGVLSMLFLPVLSMVMPSWSAPTPINWLPTTQVSVMSASLTDPTTFTSRADEIVPEVPQPLTNENDFSTNNSDIARVQESDSRVADPAFSKLPVALPIVAKMQDTYPNHSVSLAPSVPTDLVSFLDRLVFWTVCIWCAGFTAMTIRLGFGFWLTHRVVQTSHKIEMMEMNSIAFPFPRRTTVRESSLIDSPVVIGVLRHRILLPLAWREWSPEKLTSVIAHETAHIQRRDSITRILAEINCVLYWFHPLAWIAKMRISHFSELACDRMAVDKTGDRFEYATHLLEIATCQSDDRKFQPGIAMASHADISHRIDRLIGAANPLNDKASRNLLIAMLSVGLPTLLAIAAAQPGQNSLSRSIQSQEDESRQQDSEHRIREAGNRSTMTFVGEVFLPDGNPASNFKVHAINSTGDRDPLPTKIDGNRFETEMELQSQGRQVNQVTVISGDGEFSAYNSVVSREFRSHSSKIIPFKLKPSRKAEIQVLDNGRPVSGAHVELNEKTSPGFSGLTNDSGVFTASFPADINIHEVFAWTDEGKVGGWQFSRGPVRDPDANLHTIELTKTRKQKFRLVDKDDHPAMMLPFETSVATPEPHFNYLPRGKKDFFTTDENGEVVDPWFPDWAKVHMYITPETSEGWIREGDPELRDGVYVMRVSQAAQLDRQTITGRVNLPEGMQDGFFDVTLHSFQHPQENRSDKVHARCDRAGNFSADVIPGATYCVFVDDDHWVSNDWSGILYDPQTKNSASPKLDLSSGQKIEIEVTAGADARPLANQLVTLISRHSYDWMEDGENQGGTASRQWWARTDENGRATTYGEAGEIEVSIYNADWRPKEKVKVIVGKTSTVKFHRESAKREVTGQLRLPAASTAKLEGAEVLMFAMDGATRAEGKAVVDAEGTFTTEMAGEQIAVFARTKDGKAAGWVLAENVEAGIVLKLKPCVPYYGQIFDDKGSPVIGKKVRMVARVEDPRKIRFEPSYVTSSFTVDTQETTTDRYGKFSFPRTPQNIRLNLSVDIPDPKQNSIAVGAGADYSHRLGRRFVVPGEVRPLDVIRLGVAEKSRSLIEYFDTKLVDCRLSSTHCLVTLYGNLENENRIRELTRDSDDVREFGKYLPVWLSAKRTSNDEWTEYFRLRNWKQPEDNQIMLVVLDQTGKELARAKFDTKSDDIEAAIAKFVIANQPKKNDAQLKLQSALADAKESNRHVWLQFSQTRCAPCFRLSRWVDEHVDLLKKDYVVLKIDTFNDEHGFDIWKQYEADKYGIPFTIVLDADGKLVAESAGPLGNAGYPSSLEGRQTFRRMFSKTAANLSEDQVDKLIDSLEIR